MQQQIDKTKNVSYGCISKDAGNVKVIDEARMNKLS